MQNQSERKVVEVFKTFFEKIVLPSVRNQPRIMEQWKYLTSIMTQEPLEHSKLELYMTMLNHQKLASSGANKPAVNHNPNSRKEFTDSSSREYRFQKQVSEQDERRSSPFKSSDNSVHRETRGIQQQKRKLLSALQNFHTALITNQQKLQNDFKKDQRRYV